MQEQMNSMNDSGDFQDVESNYSGRLSHVSSQPAMIPSSRTMFGRDKRLPLDTGNQSGSEENVFGNQFSTFDSARKYKENEDQFHKQLGQGPREVVPEAGRMKVSHTSEDRQNKRHNSNADICDKAVDYEFYNTGGIAAELHGRTAEKANIGIAIRQIP